MEKRALANAVGLALEPAIRSSAADPYTDADLLGRLVREALLGYGLGQNDPEAPLRDIIAAGGSVLLKPSWVLHRNAAGHGLAPLVTSNEFILAVLKEVVRAEPGRIVLGDAPVQSCNFAELVTPEFEARARDICGGIPVQIVDFRSTVWIDPSRPAGIETTVRPADRYVQFDLGEGSLLEGVARQSEKFRISCYDHRDLQRNHQASRHRYLMCKELFEADTVISLPKLKTHKLAGLTGALKNTVGFVGSKDCLPHYRRGCPGSGGDSYERRSWLRAVAESLNDQANLNLGSRRYSLYSLAGRAFGLLARLGGNGLKNGGRWFGNDTVWRMALDLNRIAWYGKIDGAMSRSRQRIVWSLTDAIIAGQGHGPLSPTPLRLGAVTFSGSPVAADVVHAGLMGFDPAQIPLCQEAFSLSRWRLVDEEERIFARFDGEEYTPGERLSALGVKASPHPGWKRVLAAAGGRDV